jgi:hypothetical protein
MAISKLRFASDSVRGSPVVDGTPSLLSEPEIGGAESPHIKPLRV